MACCQRGELVPTAQEERVGGDKKRLASLLYHGGKCSCEVIFAAGMKDEQFLPERSSSRPNGTHFDVGVGIVGIQEKGDGGSLRHEFMQ